MGNFLTNQCLMLGRVMEELPLDGGLDKAAAP